MNKKQFWYKVTQGTHSNAGIFNYTYNGEYCAEKAYESLLNHYKRVHRNKPFIVDAFNLV